MTFEIVNERAHDAALIDPLLDRTFGPDRRAKTVYRLRQGRPPLAALSFVAVDPDGGLLGCLRFWPIRISRTPAILLGPLAVEPALQGRGIGRALVGHGLAQARRQDRGICLVVGEPAYYAPYGFAAAPAAGPVLPGPVEPRRFLAAALIPDALDGVSGPVSPGAPGSANGSANGSAPGSANDSADAGPDRSAPLAVPGEGRAAQR